MKKLIIILLLIAAYKFFVAYPAYEARVAAHEAIQAQREELNAVIEVVYNTPTTTTTEGPTCANGRAVCVTASGHWWSDEYDEEVRDYCSDAVSRAQERHCVDAYTEGGKELP